MRGAVIGQCGGCRSPIRVGEIHSCAMLRAHQHVEKLGGCLSRFAFAYSLLTRGGARPDVAAPIAAGLACDGVVGLDRAATVHRSDGAVDAMTARER